MTVSGGTAISSEARESIELALIELELSPETLRRDPSGRSWLPSALAARVDAFDEGPEVLREFVETELALFDGATLPADPWFARRVVDALPGAEVDHRRRRLILATTHGIAAMVALAISWPWIQELATGGTSALASVDPTHGWVDAMRSGGMTLAVALGAVALALALPFRGRQRVRSGA